MIEATLPAEDRGLARDDVRLLVSTSAGHVDASFVELAQFLEAGDLLVVNDSATIAASLAGDGFLLNLSTDLGGGVWLAEPRASVSTPGPLALTAGQTLTAGGVEWTLIAPYPSTPRLWFVRGDAAHARGRPIRYAYLERDVAIERYQTVFARRPGSAEMPSAGRPFTRRVLESLQRRGVRIAAITLHTGVSSLEATDGPPPPERFAVSEDAARAVNEAPRVIAVGTTVVRALESARVGEAVKATRGLTNQFVTGHVHTVDGLLTGFHEPASTHLAMLEAVAGPRLVKEAYERAERGRYLWHEFGDVHLLVGSRERHR